MTRDNKLCGSAPSEPAQCNALALGLMRGWLLALAWPRVVDRMACRAVAAWWLIRRT